MTHPVRPTSSASAGLQPGHMAGLLAVGLLWACTTLWLSAGVLAWLSRRSWTRLRWGPGPAIEALTAPHGLASVRPQVDTTALAVVWALLTVLPLAAAGLWLARRQARRPAADDPLRSLAAAAEVKPLTLPGLRSSLGRLRPTLADPGKAPEQAAGWPIGALRTLRTPDGGVQLRGSWEDAALVVMGPRSGKTTGVAIPAICDAPGPLVVTSNKAELVVATAAFRAEAGDQVWVFDPQQIAHTTQQFWWNPLGPIRSVSDAERLASHFVAGVTDASKTDIWGPAATEVLGALILAAACSGRDVSAVYEWLADPDVPDPARLLANAGFTAAAAGLRGHQTAAEETRASVWFTARAATRCLRDPDLTTWVTPQADMPQITPADLPTASAALYLLSKESGGSAAPLVAALVDEITRAAVVAAEAAGGRLDPPLLLVLDEAANVCPIADLPDLYSHLGSRGVVPITVLQSYAQAEKVWGKPGASKLWSSATVKLIGAGVDDAGFADQLSRLVGEHDVTTASMSVTSATSRNPGSHQHSTSVRTQRILTPGQVRALPKGSALLLASGMPAASIQLQPAHLGEHAAALAAHTTAGLQQLTSRARTAAGRQP